VAKKGLNENDPRELAFDLEIARQKTEQRAGAAAQNEPVAPTQAPSAVAEPVRAPSPQLGRQSSAGAPSLGDRLRQERAARGLGQATPEAPAIEAAPDAGARAEPDAAVLVETAPQSAGPDSVAPKGAAAAQAPTAVALFDLDGTLTGPSTIGLFFLAAAGPWRVLSRVGDLWRDKKEHKAGRMSFEQTLARAGEWLIEDLDEGRLERAGERVARWLRWMPKGWNKKAINRLRTLHSLGARVELVSGSFPWVVRPLAEEWGVGFACSEWVRAPEGWTLRRAMVEEAKAERVRSIRAQWPGAAIWAFGNSFGDKAMLLLADESWFVDGRGRAPRKMTRAEAMGIAP
jgi:phosphoserine phosphatase